MGLNSSCMKTLHLCIAFSNVGARGLLQYNMMKCAAFVSRPWTGCSSNTICRHCSYLWESMQQVLIIPKSKHLACFISAAQKKQCGLGIPALQWVLCPASRPISSAYAQQYVQTCYLRAFCSCNDTVPVLLCQVPCTVGALKVVCAVHKHAVCNRDAACLEKPLGVVGGCCRPVCVHKSDQTIGHLYQYC